MVYMLPNACGQMGHAAAEAAVRAGLPLVPFSYGGDSEDGKEVDVNGVKVTIVSPKRRVEVLEQVCVCGLLCWRGWSVVTERPCCA